jgi:hypothetical protein
MRFLIVVICMVVHSIAIAQVGQQNNSQINTPVSPSKEEMLDTLNLRQENVPETEFKSEDLKEQTGNKKAKSAVVTKNSTSIETESVESSTKTLSSTGALIPVVSQFESVQQSVKSSAISRSPSPLQQQQMDASVKVMEQLNPSSFEYHLSMYTSGNYNTERIHHLNEAESFQPNHPVVQAQKTAYFIAIGDTLNATNYLNKLAENGWLTPDVIDYTKDVLLSVPNKGCLITHGFDDSYGAYYNQQVNAIRTDVCVASLDFMQGESYQELMQKRDLDFSQTNTIDTAFFDDFCLFNETKNFAVSLTVPKEYLFQIKDKLFINGLTLNYRLQEPAGLLETNEYLWNGKLNKTLLDKTLTEKGKSLSANYLPMLFTLKNYYNRKGYVQQELEIQVAIEKIAKLSGKSSLLKSSQKKNK